jgi:hypothetical protein
LPASLVKRSRRTTCVAARRIDGHHRRPPTVVVAAGGLERDRRSVPAAAHTPSAPWLAPTSTPTVSARSSIGAPVIDREPSPARASVKHPRDAAIAPLGAEPQTAVGGHRHRLEVLAGRQPGDRVAAAVRAPPSTVIANATAPRSATVHSGHRHRPPGPTGRAPRRCRPRPA